MAFFSIVVPAYNAAGTMRETLDAIAAQVYSDWECVVVDDGSVDETQSIADAYADADSRFVVVSQNNQGAACAYRTGAMAAKSDWIVICAADDLLLPAHLSTMSELIKREPDYDIYSCNGQYLYESTGNRRIVYSRRQMLQERSLTFEEVLKACFFSVGAACRKTVYQTVGGHRPGVYVDDYDLWLRAMAAGARHRYTPAVLAVHRVSSFQQSADLRRVYDSNLEVYGYLMSHVGLSAEQRILVQERVRDTQRQLRHPEVSARLEAQSIWLRGIFERALGPRADSALKVVHSFSWLTRPVREAVLRRRRSQ